MINSTFKVIRCSKVKSSGTMRLSLERGRCVRI
jgi:hypothetical protein